MSDFPTSSTSLYYKKINTALPTSQPQSNVIISLTNSTVQMPEISSTTHGECPICGDDYAENRRFGQKDTCKPWLVKFLLKKELKIKSKF
jgi:hypothetical protein